MMSLKQNMGTIDRVVRVVVALAIAALYFTNVISGVLAIILGVVAAIFLVTGLVGVCPLYLPFNISTKRA